MSCLLFKIKSKKGNISLVVAVFVIVVIGLLIMGIFGEQIKNAFTAATDPLLKRVGLEEDDSEQQVVEQELLENAKKAFNNFNIVIAQCKNSQDLKCGCGVMDFTQLNNYKILLSSNNQITKNSFLTLLDSKGIQVGDQTPIENFPTLPEDIYKDSGKFNDYKNKDNYLRFSIGKVVYGIDGTENNKFEGKMRAIYFSKPELGVTVFNGETMQACERKCPAFTSCRQYGQDGCNDCGIARSNRCQWADFKGSDDECINPSEGSILHIKIDPGDNPTETWSFHLTNNPGHDGKNGFSQSYCNVYATNEEGLVIDHSSVWYINPGGRIVRTFPPLIETIFNGLNGYVAAVSDDNKASPYDISGRETIGGEPYTIDKNTKCSDNDPECRMFLRNPDSGNNYDYWPKYGLICDNDKKWRACDENAKGQGKTIGSNKYECAEETYSLPAGNIYYYTWKII